MQLPGLSPFLVTLSPILSAFFIGISEWGTVQMNSWTSGTVQSQQPHLSSKQYWAHCGYWGHQTSVAECRGLETRGSSSHGSKRGASRLACKPRLKLAWLTIPSLFLANVRSLDKKMDLSEAGGLSRDEELCCILSDRNLAKQQHTVLSLTDWWPARLPCRQKLFLGENSWWRTLCLYKQRLLQ